MAEQNQPQRPSNAFIPEYWIVVESIYLITGKEVISGGKVVAVNEPNLIRVVLPTSLQKIFGQTADIQIVGYSLVGFDFFIRSTLLGNRNFMRYSVKLPSGAMDFNAKAQITSIMAEAIGVQRPSLAECFTSKDPSPKLRILQPEHQLTHEEYSDFETLLKNMAIKAHKIDMPLWLYEQ